MVKCEKFTNKYVPNIHTEKSVNSPVTMRDKVQDAKTEGKSTKEHHE